MRCARLLAAVVGAIVGFGSGPTFGQLQAASPVAGDLVITELMANPKVISDNDGEYFEVCNISTHPIDLLNCDFGDITATGGASIVLVPFALNHVLQPGEFCVFIRNYTNSGWTIAGQHVDYACGLHVPGCVAPTTMNLGNSTDGDGIRLHDAAQLEIEAVGFGLVPAALAYAGWWAGIPPALSGTVFEGSSYERRDLRAPWVAGNVFPSTTPLDLNGNFGTPAHANSGDVTRPWFRAIDLVQPGAFLRLHMLSPRDGGRLVYAGASFSNAPTPVGPFNVELQLDDLFFFTTAPNNGVFNNFALSTLDAFGAGMCTIGIPNDPGLVAMPVT